MIIPHFSNVHTQGKKVLPVFPSLVVCRDFGARGLTVCKLIQKYLSKLDESGEWELYAQAAHEMEANHEAFLKNVGLDQESEAESILEREALIRLIQRGHGIFVGDREVECAHALTNAFRVRLTGSMANRIEWLERVYGLDAATARLCILSHEETRRNRTQLHGFGIENPLNYHLTLNTDDLSESLICRLIADSLMEWWEDQTCVKTMEDQSQSLDREEEF